MSQNNVYEDVNASLLRFTSDFCRDMTQFGTPLSPLNFDTFGDPQEWPSGDLFGPGGTLIDIDEGSVKVTLAWNVATSQDPQLTRMNNIINRLLNKLAIGQRIVMFEAKTGAPRGHLNVLSPVRVGAMLDTDAQPARPVVMTLRSDQM